jgi:GNAT superfamily N-acetyltransferase
MGRGSGHAAGSIDGAGPRTASRGLPDHRSISPAIHVAASDQIGDEYHGTLQARHPESGEPLGTLDFGLWHGNGYLEAHIKNIEVAPQWRRHGIAQQLLAHLISEHPHARVNPGMLTDDGAALWESFASQHADKLVPAACAQCGRVDGHYFDCPIARRAEEDLDPNYWEPGERVVHATGEGGTVVDWRPTDDGPRLEIVQDNGSRVLIDENSEHGFQRSVSGTNAA